jgi:hypothetical protein
MTVTVGSHPAPQHPAAQVRPEHAKVTDPPATIDVRDGTATDYWAYRLSVSHEALFAAIGEVGSSVAAVRRHLQK